MTNQKNDQSKKWPMSVKVNTNVKDFSALTFSPKFCITFSKQYRLIKKNYI